MDDITRTSKMGYASQCEGKVAFKKQRFASAAAKRRDGRVVYRCQHCFMWHVGTPEPRKKRAEFKRRSNLVKLFLDTDWNHE